MTPVRIALVDDHPVVLAGIRALLQGVPEVELVGEANTGATGLKAICDSSPADRFNKYPLTPASSTGCT